jgi:hypothetical protein
MPVPRESSAVVRGRRLCAPNPPRRTRQLLLAGVCVIEIDFSVAYWSLACAGLLFGQESVPGRVQNHPQKGDRFWII